MRRSSRSRWALVVAIATLVIVSGSVARAGGPTISLDPGSGSVGDPVSVSGGGWSSGSVVELFWDGPDDGIFLGRFTVTRGFFVAEIVVPSTSLGSHVVVACEVPGNQNKCPGIRTRVTAEAFFRVNAPATPTTDSTAVALPPLEDTTTSSSSTSSTTSTTAASSTTSTTSTTTSTTTTTVVRPRGRPTATVDRQPVVPGGTLVVSGTSCGAHEPVRARVDGADDDVLLAVADGGGAFTGALSGPDVAGRFEVAIECGTETVVLTIDLAQSSSSSSGAAATAAIVLLFLLLACAVFVETRPAAAQPDG